MIRSIGEEFEQNGYVVLEQVFTQDEVKSYKEEIQRIIAEVERENKGKNLFSNGVYVGLAARSKLFQAVARDQRLVAPLQQIIGDHITFLSDKVVAKNASTNFASPWHQDWPYWWGAHKISIWIALDPTRPENGCLRLLPGSHKQKFDHQNHDNSQIGFVNRIDEQEIELDKAVDMIAQEGTAVIFHDLTLHASYPNRSGQDRWALISTYQDGREEVPDWALLPFDVTPQL